MKMTKRELKQLINESVNNYIQKLNENQQEKDFARQICEFINEKAKVLNCDKKELANYVIKKVSEYFKN